MAHTMTGLKDALLNAVYWCLLMMPQENCSIYASVSRESTFDYMISTRLYVEQHGKPLAFYSDKHSVFRVNQSSKKDTKITQFGRVLSTLNIDIIFANSPRPKAVERRIELQDRLIKEMRLEGICSIEQGMPGYPASLSSSIKFAKMAFNPKDLHRTITETAEELDDIFTWREPRRVTNSPDDYL